MQTPRHRKGIALGAFGIILVMIVWLAFSSTTWAAPGAQGTVPTAPVPTAEPLTPGPPPPDATDVPPTSAPPTSAPATPGDDGGDGGENNNQDNNNNDSSNNDNDSNDDSGSGGEGQPTVSAAPGTGSVCAIGDTGAQCAATDLVVAVGAGAASAGSALTIEGSFPQPPCPASPAGQDFLNRCFRYSWIGTDAQPLDAISAPVQYCISYGPEELAAAKDNPNAMLIGLAGADGAWTLLKPSADPAGNRTCATSDQLSVWSALFVPQNPTDLLPTVGAPQNSVWLAVLAAVGGGLILLAARTRRAR